LTERSIIGGAGGMKVLLADDDSDLVDIMTYALRRVGFNVLAAIDGQQALSRVEKEHPEIVLLDLNLPKINGFEVCRRIRQEHNTAIIALTARVDEDAIIRAFQLGVDDYVCKPFSTKQLIARMQAVCRRYWHSLSEPEIEVRAGDLHLDLQSHRATKAGVQVPLTPLELRILYLLVVNEGRVIPYSRLIEYGWGYEGGDSTLLKTHIYHIRRKLRLSPRQEDGIRAVHRIGYSFGRN
jgi:DNA-binding response OmpR family regulator